MSFCNGFCVSGRNNIAFVYLTEFLTPQCVNLATLGFLFFDGFSCLFIAVYFEFINKHWQYVTSIGIVMAVVSFAGILVFIPESPLWLLKTG